MPERKLPVVRLIFGNGIASLIGGDQLEIRDGKVYAIRGTLARIPEPIDCTVETSNNIPRAQANEVVTCGECEHFYRNSYRYPATDIYEYTNVCRLKKGLREPERESSCSYAKPRKASGDGDA